MSTIRKSTLSSANISHEYSSDEDKALPTNSPSTYINLTVTKSSTFTINRVNDSKTSLPSDNDSSISSPSPNAAFEHGFNVGFETAYNEFKGLTGAFD